MFHHWQIILGLLVYRGVTAQPPNKSKEHDFYVEHKLAAHTVFARISGRTEPVPVFHAVTSDHAEKLKKAFPLQSHYSYI